MPPRTSSRQHSLRSSKSSQVAAEESGGKVEPPRRRYRDEVSVLRALSSTVEPATGLPDYRCLPEPWLGSSILSRTFLQAKAAGRNAARHVARSFLPNDLTALATELPRIDCLVPLQTAEFIRSQLAEGKISEEEAIDRLILLLNPKGAWTLYVDSKSVSNRSVVFALVSQPSCYKSGDEIVLRSSHVQ
ncbi:unnamed protein product [Dibothriocephalus latus]|uniref:Uncharacterized protein n=1 Tax=Dibothriocephalus latus TaxID=60516 RepID=A0A3P7MVJ6_DIBLA|nr:unnamed protein product [Dibothriocephalus latus]